MTKELYLYSPIYDYVAEALVKAMEDNKGSDIVIRSNTPGGNVFSGWGIIAKMQELQRDGKDVTIKVDGAAMSMGFAMLPFASNVEALDVSTFMMHRASMYVSNQEDQDLLNKVNKDLQAKLNSKIDNKKLKAMKGYTVDELFAAEERINIFLTSKEAKQIGLVDKIVKLNPQEIEAFTSKFFDIAAESTEENPIKPKPLNSQKMNIEKLKAENPEVYNQIFAAGVAKEKDRTGAWMAFVKIDAEAVAKGIKEGAELSATAMAELSLKLVSAAALKTIAADSKTAVETDEPEAVKTEKEKTVSAFEEKVKANLKKGQPTA